MCFVAFGSLEPPQIHGGCSRPFAPPNCCFTWVIWMSAGSGAAPGNDKLHQRWFFFRTWFCCLLGLAGSISTKKWVKGFIRNLYIWLVVEPTNLENMLVKLGIFPKFSGWKYKIFETTNQCCFYIHPWKLTAGLEPEHIPLRKRRNIDTNHQYLGFQCSMLIFRGVSFLYNKLQGCLRLQYLMFFSKMPLIEGNLIFWMCLKVGYHHIILRPF